MQFLHKKDPTQADGRTTRNVDEPEESKGLLGGLSKSFSAGIPAFAAGFPGGGLTPKWPGSSSKEALPHFGEWQSQGTRQPTDEPIVESSGICPPSSAPSFQEGFGTVLL